MVLALHLLMGSAVAAQPDADVVRWAEQVLLGPEYGGQEKVCSRWVASPRLSVFGASAQEEKVVAEVVAHLNETLARTRIGRIRMVASNDPRAEIRVYFAPISQFPTIAQQHGFRYFQGNLGYFWTFWNGRHEIYRAIVLLASDRLQGQKLRHFALEEITQSLGLSNDSPVFPDSVFFAKGGDGGAAQTLSDSDKRLLALFYNHIWPGMGPASVRAALMRYW